MGTLLINFYNYGQNIMESQQNISTQSSVLTKNQKIKTGWRIIENGERRIRATICYDDECGNGHNSFSITGETQRKGRGGKWEDDTGGCIHDEIEKHFPEYKHLIKWHLVSSDGPMDYVANTLYYASDKDCWGLRKGEPSRFEKVLKFKDFPITFKIKKDFAEYLESLGKGDINALVIEAIEHKRDSSYDFAPNYTFQGFADEWYKCPFSTLQEAEQMREALQMHNFTIVKQATAFSEGKERDLDAARSVGIWPDATDEELLADNLKEKLLERLAPLLASFRVDIELLGFTY